MKTKILIAIILLFPLLIVSAQVMVGQIDDFEDGTTQGWSEGAVSPNPPTNISTGGPAGTNDNYLRNVSTGGVGAGSKMVIFNQNQWLGNYTSQGIVAIRFNARVITSNLNLRIAMNGLGGTISTTNSVLVTAGSGWNTVVIPIAQGDMQAVGGASVATTLSNCTDFRILHRTTPGYTGDSVAATLEIDNIEALSTLGFDDLKLNYFSILPNPVNSMLQLKTNNNTVISELKIFDILGKKVYSKEINNSIESIDVSNLKQGVYLLMVSNENSSQFKKFIKN